MRARHTALIGRVPAHQDQGPALRDGGRPITNLAHHPGWPDMARVCHFHLGSGTRDPMASCMLSKVIVRGRSRGRERLYNIRRLTLFFPFRLFKSIYSYQQSFPVYQDPSVLPSCSYRETRRAWPPVSALALTQVPRGAQTVPCPSRRADSSPSLLLSLSWLSLEVRFWNLFPVCTTTD